jgi:hypothetical protein
MRPVIKRILLALADAGGQLTHQQVISRLLRRNYSQGQIQRMLDGELLYLVEVEKRQIEGTSTRIWKITDRGYEALNQDD